MVLHFLESFQFPSNKLYFRKIVPENNSFFLNLFTGVLSKHEVFRFQSHGEVFKHCIRLIAKAPKKDELLSITEKYWPAVGRFVQLKMQILDRKSFLQCAGRTELLEHGGILLLVFKKKQNPNPNILTKVFEH